MTADLSPKLDQWLWYIESKIGFVLPKAQHRWLVNAVNATAQEAGYDTETLFGMLDKKPNLSQLLIDRVLINESRFFRDEAALDFVRQLYEKHTATQTTPFLAMSVGCSTGQEAWSLALVLKKSQENLGGDFLIVGLDASEQALSQARTAAYPATTLVQIPKPYLAYIDTDTQSQMWQIDSLLQKQVDFVNCNVFSQEDFERAVGRYTPTLILCQNVLIYFRRFDQRDILERLSNRLALGGYLVLGAAEGLFWNPSWLVHQKHIQANAWQKIKNPKLGH